jgi:formate dehydrogenase iron-sulfur subunit
VPTTRYRTTEDLTTGVTPRPPTGALRPAHAHPPLTVMLVLTQLAVGTLLVLVAAALPGVGAGAWPPRPRPSRWVPPCVALGASVLHLGRPLQAWRAVLGLRHSWLSREIVAFGTLRARAAGYAGAGGARAARRPHRSGSGRRRGDRRGGAVGTSVMVYAVTGRRWWSLPRVAGRFGLTTVLGGADDACSRWWR